MEKLEWRHDNDQAQSVRLFTEANPEHVLLYQEYQSKTSAGQEQPFMLGWTSPDLVNAAVKFGNGRAFAMDSTFATNNLKVTQAPKQSKYKQYGQDSAWSLT